MAARPDPREPLTTMLKSIGVNDREMRSLLRDSAAEARDIMATVAKDSASASVRAAQLEVAAVQEEMWARVEEYAIEAIKDGIDAAADSVAHLTEMYARGNGVATSYLHNSVLAQAREGTQSLISRSSSGVPLKQQVYRTSVLSGQQLDRKINALLRIGASAKEIATSVYQHVSPSTSGGASYAAMRLGRTELNNAFHQTSIRLHGDNPFVEAMKWNLSESHPRADECNDYAENTHFRGGEVGVFRKGDVPGKPHPQCFCYITPVMMDDDEFVDAFSKGKFDNWIDNSLGGQRA